MPAPDVAVGVGPAVDPAPPTDAAPAASAAPAQRAAPSAAVDIPVTGAGRGPAGQEPAPSGRGGFSAELDARRGFIGALRAQQVAVPDEAGSGPVVPDSGGAHAEESAGSDL